MKCVYRHLSEATHGDRTRRRHDVYKVGSQSDSNRAICNSALVHTSQDQRAVHFVLVMIKIVLVPKVLLKSMADEHKFILAGKIAQVCVCRVDLASP